MMHSSAISRTALLEHGGVPPGLVAACASFFGVAGFFASRTQDCRDPTLAEAAGFEVGGERQMASKLPHAASAAEGSGFAFSFLTPEYRRNVFFIYEKRLRVHSPPEKVFEYFSSVKSNEGTFMTSLDLMRAAVPVFQPVNSAHIRSGFLGGEHRDDEDDKDASNSSQTCPQSDFFKLFDTDGDGLISFPEYIFFITLLSLPESQVKSTFLKFDADGSGKLCRAEFIEMMKIMRRSTHRGKATGLRTGLKATNVDDLSSGLVSYLFGDPGKEHKLTLHQFENFLHKLRSEIDELEFKHYDFTNVGSISVQDFGYSVVAGANVQRMQYFIERTAKLASSSTAVWDKRVSKSQFMAFCRLLKHGGARFRAKMQAHLTNGGRLNKKAFLKLAKECGEHLSEVQVDVIFFIFDIDGDGELSPEELLDVVCRSWD